ncbi:MAG: RNA methyltransferase [Eikenella sp.]|nr:RNA methyltransferase [Eikenella sp.]
MNMLSSAQNPALKHLAKLLQSGRARRQHGQAVVEGAHLLSACLDNGIRPLKVYVPAHRCPHPETSALLARLPADGVVRVGGEALRKITSLTDAEEITALITLPPARVFDGGADCVVLERIQDPGNIGTILRSAAAAGIKQVVLDKGCADVWSPKVLRAGMGAHFLLQLHGGIDLPAWRQYCRVPLLATALHADSVSLYDCRLHMPTAWLFGNEGSGISPAMQEAADGLVHIPMPGATESLNVAMAATVCLFEQMRQRIATA